MQIASRLTLFSGLATLPALGANTSYHRDVRPIIQRHCQGCHQPNIKSSNLDLTTYEGLIAGGKRGGALQKGAPAESLLVKSITGDMQPKMPMGQAPLSAEQIETIRKWIAEGAADDTPPEARDTVALDKPITYSQPPVITSIAFSPDGGTLAVSGYREILLIPSEGTAPARRLVGMSERLHSLAFSKDGALLIAAGGTPARFGEIQMWDVSAGKALRSVSLTNDTVFGASLTPDSKLVAVGCADNTVRIIEAATGKEVHKIGNHENWVLGTVFGKDGKRIVSVGRDRAAKLTATDTGAFLENVNKLRGELNAIARHPTRDIVVVGGEDRIPYVYMMDRPKNMKIADDTTLIREIERQPGPIFALAWSPDGRQIAVASGSPEVNVYDAESGKRVASLKGHSAGIYTLAYSPDSKRLATGGFDGKVRLYDTSAGTLVRDFIPVPIQSAAVTK
jgi:WD40 repeat protein/mono/diheme cytochrome c family protein